MAEDIMITDTWHCVSCIYGRCLLVEGKIHNVCVCASGVVTACLKNNYLMYEKHPAVRIISLGGDDECAKVSQFLESTARTS